MPLKDLEARKAYQKDYASRNKEKACARVKAWRAANPAKRAEQSKRYAAKHPEKLIEKTTRWRNKNPERAAELSKLGRQRNKGRIVANKAKYRAGKTNRTPAWLTESDFLRIKCKYQLAAMLNKHGVEPWEVDHIIPLHGQTVSGLHVPSNLRVITARENRLKNNRLEESYA
jgi:hypothetical protein